MCCKISVAFLSVSSYISFSTSIISIKKIYWLAVHKPFRTRIVKIIAFLLLPPSISRACLSFPEGIRVHLWPTNLLSFAGSEIYQRGLQSCKSADIWKPCNFCYIDVAAMRTDVGFFPSLIYCWLPRLLIYPCFYSQEDVNFATLSTVLKPSEFCCIMAKS